MGSEFVLFLPFFPMQAIALPNLWQYLQREPSIQNAYQE